MSIFFLFCLILKYVSSQAPFTDAEMTTIRGYFTSNMEQSGAHEGFVVAAPMKSNPDYYYHWQRDAGVSMHTLQYTDVTNTTFDPYFQNYTSWVECVQQESDPNNINILGEPKFNPDCTAFGGGWCRPQNDGPASRAIALIGYANWLLDNGNKDFVTKHLYNPNGSTGTTCQESESQKKDCGYVGITQQECQSKGCCWQPEGQGSTTPWCYYPVDGPSGASGTIPTDLNYVNNVWQDTSNNCDLWEEVRGPQFYTYMVQRYALLYGSKLATRLGDTSSANKWSNSGNNMVSSIKSFENNGIISEKQRVHDCSVIVGSLYGGTPDKFMPNEADLYPPSNEALLSTITENINYFQNEFPLNQENANNGIKGTFVGRYANDVYPGCSNNGGSKGHAWLLCTNAIADVFYRNAGYWYQNRNNVNKMTKSYLKSLSKLLNITHLPKAREYISKYVDIWDTIQESEKSDVIKTVSGIFAQSGDDQLQGVSNYTRQCNLHFSEQVCEVNTSNGGGLEVGAPDLTWSYGTILSAMYYRNESLNIGVKPWIHDRNTSAINMIYNRMMPQQDCAGNLCDGQCHD